MARTEKKKAPEITVERARMMNGSLFEKDTFRDGKPAYKIEVALPKDDKATDALIDAIYDGLADLGIKGKLDIDGGDIISGIKDGDVLAKKREKNDKPGDGYKDQFVIRMKTSFNRNGDDAPGGIAVFDEDVKPVLPANASKVYNGCYVQVVASLGTYTDDDTGNDALVWYLGAVQKVDDGERFAAAKDYSSAFKKIGGGRRSRDEDAGEDDRGSSRGGRDRDEGENTSRRSRGEDREERPSRGGDNDRGSSRGRREEADEAPRRGRRE